MAFWYNLWSFGIFFPIWYVWTKKNLATLETETIVTKLWTKKSENDDEISFRRTVGGFW
jgi:hypothetical protein